MDHEASVHHPIFQATFPFLASLLKYWTCLLASHVCLGSGCENKKLITRRYVLPSISLSHITKWVEVTYYLTLAQSWQFTNSNHLGASQFRCLRSMRPCLGWIHTNSHVLHLPNYLVKDGYVWYTCVAQHFASQSIYIPLMYIKCSEEWISYLAFTE